VKRRAVLSVMANPACENKVMAEKAVNEVWESCSKDTRPFDEVRYRLGGKTIANPVDLLDRTKPHILYTSHRCTIYASALAPLIAQYPSLIEYSFTHHVIFSYICIAVLIHASA